jgi:3-methyladenine DNA glycosylase/8-oxoguanine DNA glycosylase
MSEGPTRRLWKLCRPLDLRLTLGPIRRGRADPTVRLSERTLWRATRTPEGPVTLVLEARAESVEAWAWGPGREWALEAAPELIGEHDDPSGLVARHPLLHTLQRRLVGLRIGRTKAVIEALVPSILEQKVPGAEAWRAYRALVRTWGEPAPGPGSLWLPPPPEVLAAQPYWAWHRLGVERRRAVAIATACRRALPLEAISDIELPAAYRRLETLPGVGAWTAAEVGGRALGDPDAVSVGDYHIPHLVTWSLAGEARGNDRRMLELLEPYRGQRGRVIRLLEAGALRPPRRSPRMALRRIAAL